MKNLAAVAILLLLAVGPVRAQPPGNAGRSGKAAPAAGPTPSTKPTVVKNAAFQVEVTFPGGWAKVHEGATSAGAWVNLACFTEPRTDATAMLSYQASAYQTSKQLFTALQKQFKSNPAWVILRNEVRAATNHRPRGILFEYTFKGKDVPRHAIAAFWLFAGKLYRVYGDVKEIGWRTVASDMEAIVSSFALTSRAFSKNIRNFRDDAANFQMYFPEGSRVRIPASGARVVFENDRLGVSVWVYVNSASGTLKECRDHLVGILKKSGAEIAKIGDPKRQASLGIDVVTIDYTIKSDKGTFQYRDTLLLHGKQQYRLVLVGTKSRFPGGTELYSRMIGSLGFLR